MYVEQCFLRELRSSKDVIAMEVALTAARILFSENK
jgi:hypothetical protein